MGEFVAVIVIGIFLLVRRFRYNCAENDFNQR